MIDSFRLTELMGDAAVVRRRATGTGALVS